MKTMDQKDTVELMEQHEAEFNSGRINGDTARMSLTELEAAFGSLDLADPLYDGFTMRNIASSHSCCGCYCTHSPACPPCDDGFHNPNVIERGKKRR